ncbi:hypothetical protein IFM12275_67750 [Nocardia sputorum]|nr:hypothetical protein IFM12275_67750 [Nocardia sputorum]
MVWHRGGAENQADGRVAAVEVSESDAPAAVLGHAGHMWMFGQCRNTGEARHRGRDRDASTLVGMGVREVDQLSEARVIPGKELLLAAFRGLPHMDHPMLEAAGELAQLHQTRERTPASRCDKLDRRRAQLVRGIDRWVTLATPIPPPAAPEHSETVGRMVDRLAMLAAQAFAPLTHAPDSVFYDAWIRIDELADGYQDLVDDLRTGARRLPEGRYDRW